MQVDKEISKIVSWLQYKQEDTKSNGFIVGLSGGIDSAVCAALMKLANKENSLGVILPIKSSSRDVDDAVEFAKTIDMEYIILDLTKEHEIIFEKTLKSLNIKLNNDNKNIIRLADANLRARLRMSTIYSIANLKNYLVVGTDNKAELYTGYFTKYGDGGVDILPIANLLKKDVYEFAMHLKVIDSIMKRPPSAGLWEGQTDEIEMGTKYEYIDAYLQGKEIPQKDLKIIQRLHKITEHKRNIPDRIKE